MVIYSGDEVSGMTNTQFHPTSFEIEKSEPFFGDLGYSNVIPWPLIHTAGFWHDGTIPTERKLIMRADPEYFAVDDLIRSNNNLPTVDAAKAIFNFDRNEWSIAVPSGGITQEQYLSKKRLEEERDFRSVAGI